VGKPLLIKLIISMSDIDSSTISRDASTSSSPPKHLGPLQKKEALLAWKMLSPTLLIVALVVVLPLLAIFWISVKPVGLADLRIPTPSVYERLRGNLINAGDVAVLQYRISNPSREHAIEGVTLTDDIPRGLSYDLSGTICEQKAQTLFCDFGTWDAGFRDKLLIKVTSLSPFKEQPDVRSTKPITTGTSTSNLVNNRFTLDNFKQIFSAQEFGDVLYATAFYTFVGTLGAILVGLFAALMLNQSFFGQGLLRGFLLFPYVAPIIAVAFTWVTLFDPFSGSANALLLQMGLIDSPVNFFGQRGLALVMVTVFEIWRYFPLSFLFILARMQSIDTQMYEAADMDGATPMQKFWYLSIPQLTGILSILFLLRFIWTFNKFDDIFLLTGGNAGTRTLTVNVYEQAFAISNIGGGAAVAVVVFACLLVFSLFFIRFFSKEEGL